MADLPLDQSVSRFKDNEDRLDKFVNDDTGYTSSGGLSVESIPAFLDRVEGEINTTVGTVAGNVALAQSAATTAEAARDAALLSAVIYPDVASGLASTTDGDYFSVLSGNLNEYVVLYSNDTGSAVQEKVYPSAYGVNQRVNQVEGRLAENGLGVYKGSGNVWPIATDELFRVIIGYDTDLDSIVGAGLVNAQGAYDQAKNLLTDSNMANYIGSGPVYPIYTDQNFKVVLGYDVENNVIVGAGGGSIVSSGTTADALPASLKPVAKAINHIMSYGQSLSVGAAGQPALSTTQPYSNVTFNGGPRASGGDYSAFKALVEDDLIAPDGGTNRGETICSGAANYAITKAASENGIIPSNHVILGSAPGHGGYSITQLNKGTSWYAGYLLGHTQAARTLNNDYAVQVVSWMQGENDISSEMPYQTYYDHLIQLQADAEADIKAITGQSSPVFLVTYQCSWHSAVWKDVALAQLDAVRNSDKIYMSTPMYHVPYAGDNVHLNNIGYKWVGAYVGRAYKQLMFDNIKPQYINPLSATRRGNVITAKFSVPTAPLVLDATTLASTTDYGFAVEDTSGVLTISDIQVQNGNEVAITLASTPTGTTTLRYALDYLGTGLTFASGASGNLRDSTPDEITISGTPYPLYHVAPHFELTVVELGE